MARCRAAGRTAGGAQAPPWLTLEPLGAHLPQRDAQLHRRRNCGSCATRRCDQRRQQYAPVPVIVRFGGGGGSSSGSISSSSSSSSSSSRVGTGGGRDHGRHRHQKPRRHVLPQLSLHPQRQNVSKHPNLRALRHLSSRAALRQDAATRHVENHLVLAGAQDAREHHPHAAATKPHPKAPQRIIDCGQLAAWVGHGEQVVAAAPPLAQTAQHCCAERCAGLRVQLQHAQLHAARVNADRLVVSWHRRLARIHAVHGALLPVARRELVVHHHQLPCLQLFGALLLCCRRRQHRARRALRRHACHPQLCQRDHQRRPARKAHHRARHIVALLPVLVARALGTEVFEQRGGRLQPEALSRAVGAQPRFEQHAVPLAQQHGRVLGEREASLRDAAASPFEARALGCWCRFCCCCCRCTCPRLLLLLRAGGRGARELFIAAVRHHPSALLRRCPCHRELAIAAAVSQLDRILLGCTTATAVVLLWPCGSACAADDRIEVPERAGAANPHVEQIMETKPACMQLYE